jgi:hypothetical protein
LSRAKVRTDLYTPDKEYLFDNAERLSGERQGALDALSAAGREKHRERKHRSSPAAVDNGISARKEEERNQTLERSL